VDFSTQTGSIPLQLIFLPGFIPYLPHQLSCVFLWNIQPPLWVPDRAKDLKKSVHSKDFGKSSKSPLSTKRLLKVTFKAESPTLWNHWPLRGVLLIVECFACPSL
jgi:hypothetical protein